MGKIPAKRIICDECVVYVGREIDAKVDPPAVICEGEAYYPHEGEYIEILPFVSMTERLATGNLALAAIDQGDMDSARLSLSSVSLNAICEELAKRIVKWTWTDNDGIALPQPYKNPEVIKGLNEYEIFWLLGAISKGETKAQRKNA